ncbi:type II toxin-antitoxin system RelE/ParE family toxin [Aggregatibacter actinomycetemcomitans]|nr:type II toxin-antitoxin system RelE/ParE family toxin [Aggregatibacter actinomycetemcomitans]
MFWEKAHVRKRAPSWGENIILTNGFIKRTQKTPKNELANALKYKQYYQSRNSS